MKNNNWKEQFEKRADKTKGWGTIFIIGLIAYFIWQSKAALFIMICSAIFFIENISIAYISYRKIRSNKNG